MIKNEISSIFSVCLFHDFSIVRERNVNVGTPRITLNRAWKLNRMCKENTNIFFTAKKSHFHVLVNNYLKMKIKTRKLGALL